MTYYEKKDADDLRYKFGINEGWKHIGTVITKYNDAPPPGFKKGTISICRIEY